MRLEKLAANDSVEQQPKHESEWKFLRDRPAQIKPFDREMEKGDQRTDDRELEKAG